MILKKTPYFFLILLLLSVVLKNDMQVLEDSKFWSTLSYPSYISLLKNNANLILLTSFFFGFLFLIKGFYKNLNLVKNFYFFIFLIINLFMFFISFGHYSDFSFKILNGIFIYLVIYFIFSSFLKFYSWEELEVYIEKSFLYFSFIYIFFTFMTFISGNGFVEGNPRFFGITVHPNFVGVHLAICNIILLIHLILRKKNYLIMILFLVIGLFLQLITGSRTSILFFLVALLALLTFTNNFKLKIFSIISILVLVPFFIVLKDLESFDRGDTGGDTRTEAWISMYNNIIQNPIFGYGEYIGYSENSYLRIAVGFGIPLAIFFTLFSFHLVFKYYQLIKRDKHSFVNYFGFCLLLGFLAGAVLEGYLTDIWSLSKLVFVLIIIFVSGRLNALKV